MEAYKRGSDTVWDCKYRLVWVTKYRYPVLGKTSGPGAENCCVRQQRKRGNVTDEVWVEYIKNQTPPEPDDHFNVT